MFHFSEVTSNNETKEVNKNGEGVFMMLIELREKPQKAKKRHSNEYKRVRLLYKLDKTGIDW